MPDNYYSEFNENGVVTPLRDLGAFPRSEQALLGAKNFCPFVEGRTDAGVTFTVDDNGVVSCADSASGNNATAGVHVVLKAGTYILNGCPSGGASNKYKLNVYLSASPYTSLADDFGSGGTFTLANDTRVRVQVVIFNGQDATGLVFKPMIRLATDIDPTYSPYAMTNRELTEENKSINDRLGWESPYTDGTEVTIVHVFKTITVGASFIVVIKHYTSATTFDFRLGILTAYTENDVVKFAFQMLVNKDNYPTVTSVEQTASGQIKFTFSARVYAVVQVIRINSSI